MVGSYWRPHEFCASRDYVFRSCCTCPHHYGWASPWWSFGNLNDLSAGQLSSGETGVEKTLWGWKVTTRHLQSLLYRFCEVTFVPTKQDRRWHGCTSLHWGFVKPERIQQSELIIYSDPELSWSDRSSHWKRSWTISVDKLLKDT